MLAGDDHAAKSSSTAHQSDHILTHCGIPVLYPSSVQEYIDFGLHAWAMSRYTGLWVSMKCVTDIIESGAVVDLDPDRVQIQLPTDFELPEGGLNIRWPDAVLDQEVRMSNYKWYAALAYARANKLNKIIWDSPKPKIGIITAGKSYVDTRQALADLGIDEQAARDIGLRLYKVGMTWPLESEGVHEFARGLDEILVVEEKRQVMEYALKEELYNLPDGERPRVVGKFDDTGEWHNKNRTGHGDWLLPATYELNPAQIARAIASRISHYCAGHPVEQRVKERIAFLENKELVLKNIPAKANPETDRIPYFCSGCPHNSSTKVPEGSRAMAGIGCHYMVLWMDRETSTFTHMGAEGTTWIGQSPFTSEKHVFVNLGDGTYFHSGILAIRAAVAAKVNITYKILYNDAVAMTGGQNVDGPLDPGMISRQIAAEGVGPIMVVTDEPEKYPSDYAWAPGVTVHHRSELMDVQKAAARTAGRDRRHLRPDLCVGKAPPPEKRRIPRPGQTRRHQRGRVRRLRRLLGAVELPVGRAAGNGTGPQAPDQPVVLQQGFLVRLRLLPELRHRRRRRPEKAEEGCSRHRQRAARRCLNRSIPQIDAPFGILVAGVGGTGVVTVGQILAVAAHVEGKGAIVLDQSGLAQKGGPVMSHVRLAQYQADLHSTRVGTGSADLVIGCDQIVAASRDALSRMGEGRTWAAVNDTGSTTAAFVKNPEWQFPAEGSRAAIQLACGTENVDFVDAGQMATTLMGDCDRDQYVHARLRLPEGPRAVAGSLADARDRTQWRLGAVQQGRLQLGPHRRARPGLGEEADDPGQGGRVQARPDPGRLVNRRIELLTAYQNAAYAAQYKAFVDQVRARGSEAGQGHPPDRSRGPLLLQADGL